jgi:hypothetical protein
MIGMAAPLDYQNYDRILIEGEYYNRRVVAMEKTAGLLAELLQDVAQFGEDQFLHREFDGVFGAGG